MENDLKSQTHILELRTQSVEWKERSITGRIEHLKAMGSNLKP